MRGLALGVAVMVPIGASAAPWEATRKGVIDPANRGHEIREE